MWFMIKMTNPPMVNSLHWWQISSPWSSVPEGKKTMHNAVENIDFFHKRRIPMCQWFGDKPVDTVDKSGFGMWITPNSSSLHTM
jgi:hypothetical protein